MPNKIKYTAVNGIKECAVCKQMKPVGQFHKARNHYTASCRVCRASYLAEYRQRPEVKSAALEYAREYRKNPDNRERHNAATRKSRNTPRAKAIKNTTRKAWTAAVKQKCVDYKGGKCVCCGYSKCLAAMDFHHREPKEKEGRGRGGALVAHWTFERNRPELDKCELVCVRCHREIHAGIRAL